MAKGPNSVRSRLDAIAEDVKSGLTPFQQSTVEYVTSLYRSNINRVLVADEVGLGKTLVARGAIAEVARLRRDEHDNLVKVAYVCSNSAIASQNIERLRIDSDIKLSDSRRSRLSMQHYSLASEMLDEGLRNSFIQIIPLTPQTSFELSNQMGTQDERALMLAVLCLDPAIASGPSSRKRKIRLKKLLWRRASDSRKENWEGKCAYYKGDINRLAQEGVYTSKGARPYPFDVIDKVKRELLEDSEIGEENFRHTPISFDDLINHLDSGEIDNEFGRSAIVSLRRAFSKASIDLLEPDFVIMDEFQRFKNLIADDGSEASLLARRFFSGNVRILLLSATPFKMYSTGLELDDGAFGDSYKEFLEVVKFLSGDSDSRYEEFRRVWSDYNHELSSALTDEAAIVRCRESKEAAQESASGFIARTERTSTGELNSLTDNTAHSGTVEIMPGDIKAFHAARRLMEAASVQESLMDADYSKSCPYPLSFMRDYIAKKSLDRRAKQDWGSIEKAAQRGSRQLWINRNDVRSYKRLKVDNARYLKLEHDLFDEVAANLLLWVPASLPYYTPPAPSVFSKAEHFSKTPIFSSWAMVPPALSTLLSYEAERRNVQKLGADYQYFKDEDVDEETDATALPHGRMLFTRQRQNAFSLVYPSPYLADLFENRQACAGKTMSDFKRDLKKRIAQDLARAIGLERLPDGIRASRDIDWYAMASFALDRLYLGDNIKGWLESFVNEWLRKGEGLSDAAQEALDNLLAEFEEWDFRDHMREMPADIVDVLADAAIGSPAICAYRAYRQVSDVNVPSLAPFEFGIAFMRRMNTSAATLAVAAAMGERGGRTMRSTHWKRMLSYCCEGNFQAVMDEYVHLESMGRRCKKEGDVWRLHDKVIGTLDGDAASALHNAESNHVVETFNSFKANTAGQGKRRSSMIRMRTNFANAFMETKDDARGSVSRDRKRAAFNSPFWPFVLVSTSIGQEGLDFHQYCRRVVHWNLPSNPIDLEQREGRINRYKGLAVRQNVADRYGSLLKGEGSVWDELFVTAKEKEEEKSGKGESSGLLPYWGVTDSDDMVKIERFIYSYPFSKDEIRYQYLLDTVRKYRAVLGQPDQEDLLVALQKRFGSSDAVGENFSDLFMNLCPFSHASQQELGCGASQRDRRQ